MGRVAGKKSPPKMREPAKLSLPNQLPRILDQRNPTIVVPDPCEDACLAGQTLDLRRFLRTFSNRLLAENMLASGRCSRRHLPMQVIRRGDIHHSNVRIRNHVLPPGRGALEAETFLGLLRPLFYRVGTDDELRP